MKTDPLTTTARALLAALDTYREQGQLPVCDVPGCPHYSECGTIGGERTHCPYFVPPQARWLQVEVAAVALRKALDSEPVTLAKRPDLFEEDMNAASVYHAPCGWCKHRRRDAHECTKCRHYIN